MFSRFSTMSIAAAAVVASTGISQAALLTYDVRVASTGNSTGVVRNGEKSAAVTNVGDVIRFEVYGVLAATDSNSANDGISAAGGSILSGTGGLLGTLGNGVIPAAFRGSGYSGGLSVDLDGDGDLDIGSNSTISDAQAQAAFFVDRTTDPFTPVAGQELLLGTFDFTVTSLEGSSTTVNFRPAAITSGTALSRNYHAFTIDGTSYTRSTTDREAGTAVSITVVPEPASLAVLAGVAGLIGRRFRRAPREPKSPR